MRSSTIRWIPAVLLVTAILWPLGTTGAQEYGPDGPDGEPASVSDAPGTEGDGEARVPDFGRTPDLSDLRRIVLQQGGRRKPLDTFARERIQRITGEPTLDGADPVLVILGMLFESGRWEDRPLIEVGHPEVLEALGLERPGRVAPSDLMASPDFRTGVMEAMEIRREAQGSTNSDPPDLTPAQEAFLEAFEHRHFFDGIGRDLRVVPPPTGAEEAIERTLVQAGLDFQRDVPSKRFRAPWLTIGTDPRPEQFPEEVRRRVEESEELWQAVLGEYDLGDRGDEVGHARNALEAAYLAGDAGALEDAAATLHAELRAVNPGAYPEGMQVETELVYNRVEPFRIGYLIYLLAFVACVVGAIWDDDRAYWLGIVGLVAGFLVQTSGLGVRWYLAGRSPWSNLYEATVMIAWGGVLAGLVFERIYRTGLFATIAGVVGFCGLAAADAMPVAYGTHIEPLVPVLRSYWMTIHVSSLLISYGAFAVACAVGIVLLVQRVRHGADEERMERYDNYIYRVIQVGFIFLTAGIILGAVWANESWGRYWGWDPKETWAFITWCCYAAFLHGRMVGWFKGVGTAIISVIGFGLVLFTYLGVSFLLPGLHSYLG